MVPACNKHSVYREERKEKASTKEGGSYMRSSLVLFWSSLLLPMFKITEEVLSNKPWCISKNYIKTCSIFFSPLPTLLLRPNAYSKSCSFYSTHSFWVIKSAMAATAFSNVNKQLSSDPKTRFHRGQLRLCSFS